MANIAYYATSLTGGGAGALDGIVDGDELADLDGAIVITLSYALFYSLDADSGVAESSPTVIAPDLNPGDKRWVLTGISEVSAAAMDELKNIGATTITAAQWGYLGELDQSVKKDADVDFNFIDVGPAISSLRNSRRGWYDSVSVTGADTPIASLTRINLTTDSYGGLLLVEAALTTGGATNTAHYVLLVVKAAAGSDLIEIAKAGLITGGGTSWPSFTWSLDITNNHLEASPIASTTGTFHFLITSIGNINLTNV